MNISEELMQSNDRSYFVKLASIIVDKPSDFDQLIELFLAQDSRMTQRASNVIIECIRLDSFILQPFISRFIGELSSTTLITIKRNILRLLQDQVIKEDDQGILIQLCFDFLLDAEEPIAVKAFSMTIIANHCVLYPELKNELIPILEKLKESSSAGIKSRTNKILRQLQLRKA